MAILTLNKFDGGLSDNWWYGQSSNGFLGRDDIFQKTTNEIAFGYTNPLIKEGILYPETDTVSDCAQINQLDNTGYRVVGFASAPDSYVDSTMNRTILFAQKDLVHALKLTGNKILSHSDTPSIFPEQLDSTYAATPHAAHTSYIIDDIVTYQINGSVAIFFSYRDNTDGDLWAYYVPSHNFTSNNLYYNATIPDGTGTSGTVNAYAMDKNFPIFMVPSDNTFLYIFNGNSCHKFDGNLERGVRGQATNNVLKIGTNMMFVDACENDGKIYAATKYASFTEAADRQLNLPHQRIQVLIWNRISTQVSIEDTVSFDAENIFNIFSDGSNVYTWVKDSSLNISLYRITQDNTAQFLKVVGYDTVGYPANRHAVIRYNSGILWQDVGGKIYYYNPKNNSLNIVATNGTSSIGFSGAILSRNNYSMFLSRNTSGTERVSTLIPGSAQSDSNNVGNGGPGSGVEFGWFDLPKFSTINGMTVYFKPKSPTGKTANSVNFVFTFKDTSQNEITKSIDTADWDAGFKYLPIGKTYVNKFKFRVQFDSGVTYADLIEIYKIEVDYTPTSKIL